MQAYYYTWQLYLLLINTQMSKENAINSDIKGKEKKQKQDK